ncbi:hypothetical protein [Sporomusa sp.]|uniref:hypothetical protein n=1 Tax=Sporomusa sp. TaxID=2078658 RepID=UPI002CD514D9|nr:hypothetical protein [Sporomusa sp.]HWR06856.1 hypothetical protein [Sporomusa sp.]
MNSININSTAPALPVKLETADSLVVNQDSSGEVQANATGTKAAPAQAALLSLESFITIELAELGKTVTARTAVVNSLPPEVQELVKDILHQSQAAQTIVPEGVASLLKAPRTAAEKLTILAAALEQAMTGAGEDVAPPPAGIPAGKPQAALTELINVWRKLTPAELRATVKVLRELAATAASQSEQALAENPELPATVLPTVKLPAEPGPETPAPAQPKVLPGEPEVASQVLSKPDVRDAEPDKPPAAPLPGTPRQVKGDIPALPNMPQPHPDVQEQQDVDVPALLKSVFSRSEVVKSLPPEVREFIQALLRQELPAQTGNTGPQNLQTRQALQDLQDLPEPLIAFIKSTQPLPEKLALFIATLEQAAEPFSPEGRPTAKATPGPQLDLVALTTAGQGKNPEELKAAANIIRGLAETMPKPGGIIAERQDNQSILTFTVPLYFGEGQTAYPAHIHIYHQEQEDRKKSGQTVTETWLRICVETENIGLVETSFRLYDGHTVDVKVRFDDKATADDFADDVEEVKEKLAQLPLALGEFLVK